MKRAKTFLEFIFSLINRFKKTFFLIIFLLFVGSFYTGYLEHQEKNIETYTVRQGSLQEKVSLTGTVKPVEEANMNFQKSGIVKKIFVKVGEQVKEGDILAALEHSDDDAKVTEAQANLKAAQANLLDLQTSRPETLEIREASAHKALNDLKQSNLLAEESLKNLTISGNTFVRTSFAQLFTGDASTGYRMVNSSCDSQTETKLLSLKASSEKSLLYMEGKQSSGEILGNNFDQDIANVTNFLNTMKDIFYQNCYNNSTQYDSVRATISSARLSWAQLTSDYNSKLSDIVNKKLVYLQAQEDLKIAQSGEKTEKVSAQQAAVLAAQARLQAAVSGREKNILKAPFTGVITNIDMKVGELVAPEGKTLSIISDNNYEIESKVSEIDIAKISNNASATVTFDAYGDELVFDAVVSNISPAGIISDGVPTYKTIFNFIQKDDRIRGGMTANIKVKIKEHENIFSVPAEYIQTDEQGGKYVYVYKNNDMKEKRPVETGSIGTNGEVEILRGLESGEVVMLQK